MNKQSTRIRAAYVSQSPYLHIPDDAIQTLCGKRIKYYIERTSAQGYEWCPNCKAEAAKPRNN